MRHLLSRRQFLQSAGMTTAAVCAAGLLSACGSGSSGDAAGSGSADTSSYTILYSSQPSTLNYLTTASDLEMTVGANCVDTLLEFDNKGVLKEGLATEWTFDEPTLTWTFTLRDENWVDMNGEVVAAVTAQDFVDALRYELTPDYAASNVGLVTSYIAGAEDYYNYQVNLANANNGLVDDDGTTYTVDGSGVVTVTTPGSDPQTFEPVDFESVGVKAVDDHTLTYTLTYDFPGFLSLLVYLPYEPAYGPLLEEMGDQFATSAETTYSCGAFYLSEYVPLESWVMKKNPGSTRPPSAPTFWTAGWPTTPPRTWCLWTVPTPTILTSTCSTSCPTTMSSPTRRWRAWTMSMSPKTGPRPSTAPTSARPSCTASTIR